MFKFFNCFQFVSLFAAGPFIIHWLSNQNFSGSSALFYLSCVIYIVMTMFIMNVIFTSAPVDKN